MINIFAGDSIMFEANAQDANGTAIGSAIGSLTVINHFGTTVLATSVTHTSNGTYQFQVPSTLNWALGPLQERWKFFSSIGTTTFVANDNFRLVGTGQLDTYISAEELVSYYENIVDYFDGSEDAIIADAFSGINARLEALGCKLPFAPKADGFFDQPLRDLNAYEAITRIISRRQSGYNRENETPWFKYFDEQAGSIYKKIENKVFNFDRDYSAGEGGIGIATKVAGGRPGQMETNWRGNVGEGFTDASHERDWVVRMTGTGTAGEVNEGTYKWSMDGGLSFNTGFQTSYEWAQLGSGVYVRFTRGTGSGTNNIFAANDEWNWKTFPVNQTVGGVRIARSY